MWRFRTGDEVKHVGTVFRIQYQYFILHGGSSSVGLVIIQVMRILYCFFFSLACSYIFFGFFPVNCHDKLFVFRYSFSWRWCFAFLLIIATEEPPSIFFSLPPPRKVKVPSCCPDLEGDAFVGIGRLTLQNRPKPGTAAQRG